MVGIVIVSHSRKLAEGVAELAKEMGGEDVRVEVAGGLDIVDQPLGTDAGLVMRAIERAESGDGVLVLMDLGSAVLSAEMALEMLEPGVRHSVMLCEAPLVEGAVVAAVAARVGEPIERVAAEARRGLEGKIAHLGPETPASDALPDAGEARQAGEAVVVRLPVRNRLGLHARPAARFVQTAGGFDADISVANAATRRGPVSARSLNALATLGVRQGHEIVVTARGREAEEAVSALRGLAERDFDDVPEARPPPGSTSAQPARLPDEASRGLPGSARHVFTGLPVSPGIAFGDATRLSKAVVEIPLDPGKDPQHEWSVLQNALEEVREQIRGRRASVAQRVGEYEAAIFDAHLLLLEDETMLGPARHGVFEEGLNAARAWNAAVEGAAAAYGGLDDEYLRARAEDVSQVGQEVLRHILGDASQQTPLDGPGIVVARDLSPAETAEMDRALVLGIATAYGGPTSHGAILARSLGIPAVAGLGEGMLSVPPGAPLLLDGDAGALYLEPSPQLAAEYAARREARLVAERAAAAESHEPARTRDGRLIEVAANVGSPEDVPAAVSAGAEGIGLLRTEFLFMGRDSLPDEEEQFLAYRRIVEALEGRPVILRTLDVGADKPLPYLPQPPEANPFLGTRGLRLGLLQPGLLRTQLRAALRVAARYPLKLMFPMVTTLAEFREAAKLVAEAGEAVREAGADEARWVELGMMVEVPAAALAAERFAGEVDFFSVGTNDLAQYTMAAERGNDRVAPLADALSPAVLRLIREVVRAADDQGKWVGVCGEVAGDTLAVPVLIGLGVHELSMSPPAIPSVKQAIRKLDFEAARALADAALALDDARAVRRMLRAEARDGGGAGAGAPSEVVA